MAKKRLNYLDNLKIILIFLVITHHVGQAYGPTGGFWPFVSSQPGSLPWLGRFFCVNAAFFMGLFFMISGYFFTPSYDRKGLVNYSIDKLVRYGIPLAFVYFIMMPCVFYFYYMNYSGNPGISYWTYFKEIFLGLGSQPQWFRPTVGWPESNFGFGHLWFVEHLLIYSLLYAVFRLIFKRIKSNLILNQYLIVAILVVVISFLTILVRQSYPIDRWTDLFGFITAELAHLPQYAMLLITGVIAYKSNLFNSLKSGFGIFLLVIGVFMAITIYLSPYFPEFINSLVWNNFEIYETVMSVSLCFGLIVFFREKLNKTNSVLKVFSENSYGAYIFHFPIVVVVQYIFDKVFINLFLKFIVVSILSIIFSYSFSYLLRKSALLRKVI